MGLTEDEIAFYYALKTNDSAEAGRTVVTGMGGSGLKSNFTAF